MGITLLWISTVIAATNLLLSLGRPLLLRLRGVPYEDQSFVSGIPLVGTGACVLGWILCPATPAWWPLLVLALDPGGVVWLAAIQAVLARRTDADEDG